MASNLTGSFLQKLRQHLVLPKGLGKCGKVG